MNRALLIVSVVVASGLACSSMASSNAAVRATRATAHARLTESGFDAHGHVETSQASDESQIRAVLKTQAAAWNRGDIDAFMQYYWHSEKALFIGANGVTRGWQAVLDRYHRTYPDRTAMGHLTFSNIEVKQDCPHAAVVIGEYHLQHEKDNPSGVFTLNFRKFAEGWRIIVDHTTAFASSAPDRR